MILKTNYTFTVRFQRTEVEHRVDAHQPGQREERHAYMCMCVHAVAAATPPALVAIATAMAAAQLQQQATQLQQHQQGQVGTGRDKDKQVGTITDEWGCARTSKNEWEWVLAWTSRDKHE